MRWVIPTVVLAAGCNQIFGIHQLSGDGLSGDDTTITDIDHDGIPDNVDPCIAPPSEGAGMDQDGDGIADNVDPCPLDSGQSDKDADGVPDDCDPNEFVGGDDVWCRMALSDTSIEGALWAGRAGEVGWVVTPNHLSSPPGVALSTAMATMPIEGDGDTTYEISTTVETNNGDGSLTMWLGADPVSAKSSDFGCRLVVSGGQISLVALGPNGTSRTTGLPIQSLVHPRMFGTYAIGSPMTINCQLLLNGTFNVAKIDAPPSTKGRFGISAEAWSVRLDYLEVINHPTAP